MSTNIDMKEFLKAGGVLPKELQKATLYKKEVETYAMKIIGLLADAPNNDVRRKALGKARRMIGTR